MALSSNNKKKNTARKPVLHKRTRKSTVNKGLTQQIKAENVVGIINARSGAKVKVLQRVTYTNLSEDEQERQKQKSELKELKDSIEQKFHNLKRVVQSPQLTEGNPYLFMESFGLRDGPRLFGRNEVVEEVLDHLNENHTTFLDGIGKTSVLQARVVPFLLKQGHLPLMVSASAESLATSLKKQLLPSIEAMDFLKTMSLAEFVSRVTDELQKLGKRTKLFLLVDQFEALSEDSREVFREEWEFCISSSPDAHWLFSVPTGSTHLLSIFKDKVAVNPNLVTLHPLKREEALEAMLGQAALRDIQIDPLVADAILDKLNKPGIDPAQLQVVCYMLAGGKGPLVKYWTVDYYNRLGGADGILREYLDRTISELDPLERDPAWQLLAILIDPYETVVSEAQLIQKMKSLEVGEEITRDTLKDLQDSHLVEYVTAYKLVNDSLLPRIQEWLDKRAALKQAEEEFSRQLRNIGKSGLRGMIGGAVGFTLAYWVLPYIEKVPISKFADFFGFYFFNLTLRTLLGAFAGFVMILAIDIILASLKGEKKWLRLPAGMFAGATSFALALVFHIWLHHTGGQVLLALGKAFMEGIVWGAAAGAGTVWVMLSTQQTWLKLIAISALCGIVLALSDLFLHGLDVSAPPYIVFFSGMIMPVFLIGSALLSKSHDVKGWKR